MPESTRIRQLRQAAGRLKQAEKKQREKLAELEAQWHGAAKLRDNAWWEYSHAKAQYNNVERARDKAQSLASRTSMDEQRARANATLVANYAVKLTNLKRRMQHFEALHGKHQSDANAAQQKARDARRIANAIASKFHETARLIQEERTGEKLRFNI